MAREGVVERVSAAEFHSKFGCIILILQQSSKIIIILQHSSKIIINTLHSIANQKIPSSYSAINTRWGIAHSCVLFGLPVPAALP